MSDFDSHRAWHSSRSLETHLLGLVEFDSALALQERIVFELSGRTDRLGCLLLCEHPPVVTLGREATRLDVDATDQDLQHLEIPLRWIGRGGGAVIHAPGQLAIYPLLPLDRLGLGIAEFRRRLESALVDVCHELRIPAKRQADEPGVWTRYGRAVWMGAAVKSCVSCHGAFLNVSIDPSFLKLLSRPAERAATTLQALRLRPVSMSQVREAVIRHLAAAFDYSSVQTFTGHPLLKRTLQNVRTHA